MDPLQGTTGTAPVLGVYQVPNAVQVQGANAVPNTALDVPTTTDTSGGTTGTGGTTGGTITPAAPVGPTAAQLSSYNEQLNSILGGASTSAANSVKDLLGGQYGINATKAGLQNAQDDIDTQGIQANLANDQGRQGILDMIHNGLASGAVRLNAANAANSSAADALARAYSIQGRQAGAQVGNQFQQALMSQANAQTKQNRNVDTAVGVLNTSKGDAVTSIVNDAQAKLAALLSQQTYQGASPAQQVNIQQQIDAIKANAIAALSQYDDQIAGIGPTPLSGQGATDRAADMAFRGTPAENAYSFTNIAPAAFQGGASPASLPIFTAPGASKKIGALA